MMLSNCLCLALCASFFNIAHAELHSSVFISEVFFRPMSGKQPSAFLELFNGGVDTRASNYQLCYGDNGECTQLGGGMWAQNTYYVLCADISAHANCHQVLSFGLSGLSKIEIKDINWNSLDKIEMEGQAIPGAVYQRTSTSSESLVASSIQSLGSGYLGGPAAPTPNNPENTEIYQEENGGFRLFINEYNAEEGWVEIGYYTVDGQSDIGEFAITIYDPATGRRQYASRLTNANFEAGTTMNGMTFAIKYEIPNYGEQNSGVTLSGNGVIWDAISYNQPFVAQDGPGKGAISTGLGFLHGIRTGEGCNTTALAWQQANVNSFAEENPGELVTCNGQRTADSKGASEGEAGELISNWSNNPSQTPSVSFAPSDSPTVDFCGKNVCDPNARCENDATTDDGYICECRNGFTGDGKTCADVNECMDDPCNPNQNCINNAGGFECVCKEGFRGKNCVDIPECNWVGPRRVCNLKDPKWLIGGVNVTNFKRETCEELEGSYRCNCRPGFERSTEPGTAGLCQNINECLDDPCPTGYFCTDEAPPRKEGELGYRCDLITSTPTKSPTTATPSSNAPSNTPSLSQIPSLSDAPSISDAPTITFLPTQVPSLSDRPSATLFPSVSPSLSQEPSITPLPSNIPSSN